MSQKDAQVQALKSQYEVTTQFHATPQRCTANTLRERERERERERKKKKRKQWLNSFP